MRNLKLQYCKEDDTGIRNAKQLLLQPNTDHNDKQITYVVTEDKIFAVSEAKHDEESRIETKILAELPDIAGAEYLQLDNAICVATGAGEVLLINPDTLETSEGSYCDVGIVEMAWSPSQEVVAFVTKANNVVVMTCNYELLSEQPLDAELASDQQFVNVGWGKKETQFHGTAGKQAAKQSPEFKPPEDVQQLPQDIHIAWRGDGAFFVVSYVASNVGRTFSVYDNEGKLQHMAEKWNGLQSAITWRPSGNWIAVPQILKSKCTVSLFEKNGLRHREFELPFDLNTESIVKLQWNCDSDILAVQTRTAEVQHIYLYTISNYHWYLKQVLVFQSADALCCFQWSTEHMLHVLLESGKLLTYRWHFAVDSHRNTVWVIDGKRALGTDLLQAVVPPPMCQYTLESSSYINAISFKDDLALRDYFVQLHSSDGHLCIIKQLGNGKPTSNCCTMQLPSGQLSDLLALKQADYLLARRSIGSKTQLLLLSLNCGEAEKSYSVTSTLTVKGIVNAVSEGQHNTFYVHSINNAQISMVSFIDGKLQAGKLLNQLTQPADCLTATVGGVVSLRAQQLLHVDGQRIDEDVTSFILAEDYLIYTQLNSLHFVHLATRRKVASRSIERGAKLVLHAADARLVLQLPRGNLEVIYPRVLLLRLIGSLLDAQDYGKAMLIVRKHRINLNIVCDHDMQQFCHWARTFLQDMKDTQWLCLFLSELQNEDYTRNMYASNYSDSERTYPLDYQVERKVQYICELLCKHMEQQVERYRLPIITAYVKLGKLEQALQMIWQQKPTDAQLADQLLKYLLYLVDVNELYNVALGTYDFGLVLFVAQKSQKDPKEFLPFLNELKAHPLHFSRFKIDEHLKRYESALTHLAASGAEHYELALEFIKQHNLYSKALVIYQDQQQIYQRICVAFGDHLRANAQLETASIMYERGGQLQQALLSAKHTLDWQRVINLAQRAGESLEEIARSLVTPLQQQDRHLEAFELLKQFTKSTEQPPLDILIVGHLYGRAIYEARLLDADQAAELLANRIKPALTAFVEQLKSSLSADQDLFLEHKRRLLEVRKRQATIAEEGGAGDHEVDIDELDLLSDTTSMHSSRYSGSSRGTGKTFRSSKNRRKHERKLLSLKPGNPFEDIALIDALHNQVTAIAHQQQRQQLVRDTCKALLQLHTEDERAAGLQQLYGRVLSVVQASLDEIWIPELMGGTAQHLTGPNIDYLTLQKEQRFALLTPLKRFKPQLTIIDWQHSILQ